MGLLTQPLLLLHDDPGLRGRVKHAAPPTLHLVDVPDWGELQRAVHRMAPGAVALVDPYRGMTTDGPSAALGRLLRDYPRLPVLAAARFEGRPPCDVLTLGAWGVADTFSIGTGDDAPARLRRRLGAARAAYFARVLAAVPAGSLPAAGRRLLADALEVAATGAGAKAWAPARGVSERTLLRSCHGARLPPPRRLLAWMRVLLAADLLESPGHSMASVSVACGYASDMPLRRALRQLADAEPAELIAGGRALATVAARFGEELAAGRPARGRR